MTNSKDILEEVVRLRQQGIPAAMATIVGTVGSTPGQASMRLLVLEDGTFLGTVGGGCLEAEVYEAALEVIREDCSRSLKFRLNEYDSPDSGLLCGGEVTVFVEPITTPQLHVFGGGHVSKALTQVANLAGFRVVVCDDREAYANEERFPEAAQVVQGPFAETVANMSMRANSYAVIVTRGHKEDSVVLQAMAQRYQEGQSLKFLGMLGSRTKRGVLFQKLREQGVAEDFLATVRSPVGMCVGAQSHEEIAVAVVAELVCVRRLGQDAAQAWAQRPPRRLRRPGQAAGDPAGDSAGRGSGSADSGGEIRAS